MPNLTVNNNTYVYPDSGSEPGWGGEATDWASAVTEVLNSLSGAGTINETQSTIEVAVTNNDVAGLTFNSAIVEGADITYRIYRKTDSTELAEKGTMHVVYKPGSVEKWFISRIITAGDDSKVTFDIDVNGQVKYTSLAITGPNYEGYIKFKTSSILKT